MLTFHLARDCIMMGIFEVSWFAATLECYCSPESSFLCLNNSGMKLVTAYYNDIAFLHALKVLNLIVLSLY
jgi:hypothetical protein